MVSSHFILHNFQQGVFCHFCLCFSVYNLNISLDTFKIFFLFLYFISWILMYFGVVFFGFIMLVVVLLESVGFYFHQICKIFKHCFIKYLFLSPPPPYWNPIICRLECFVFYQKLLTLCSVFLTCLFIYLFTFSY